MPKKQSETPYREIPLALIDPPTLAMRETFDPAMLEELTGSIREMGILAPIIVEQRGGRYEIEDGHRRFTAAGLAGLTTIPALVRDAKDVSGEAVKCHANTFREDVNPAEEARYLRELLEAECGGDVDRLCKLTHLTRGYVEGRLLLMHGDPDVFEALRTRRLSMAVARELNKVKDRGYRMMYLDAAIRGGATARIVQEWRIQSDQVTPVAAPDSGDGSNQFTGLPAPVTTMTCVCCESDDEPWTMELIPMHRRCRMIYLDRMLARIEAGLAAAVEGGGSRGAAQPGNQ